MHVFYSPLRLRRNFVFSKQLISSCVLFFFCCALLFFTVLFHIIYVMIAPFYITKIEDLMQSAWAGDMFNYQFQKSYCYIYRGVLIVGRVEKSIKNRTISLQILVTIIWFNPLYNQIVSRIVEKTFLKAYIIKFQIK